jgi:pyrimidine-nucleoside phosphorylase
MISGRGLGLTGGTLDKLESIPGFRTDLSAGEIDRVLDEVGCVITGQTADLVPADKKLYALRDVTGTVPSPPLITASILSKKLAEDLDALVLDVKWGSGTFMKTRDEAQRLADLLQSTGTELGLNVSCVLTDMNQPLGRMAGNAVEVLEALDVLSGGGPDDVRDLVLLLGTRLLIQVGKATSEDDARRTLLDHLHSGRARERFERMVAAQGGDLKQPLAIAPAQEVIAPHGGRIVSIDTSKLGQAITALGGGRRMAGDTIDYSVGLETLVRVGETVRAGQPLLRLFAHAGGRREAQRPVREAIAIKEG